LQLGILIETMRREGFELTFSRPRVLFKSDPATGKRMEPIEEVIIDVDEEHAGIVVKKLSERRGDLVEMRSSGGGRQRLVFHVPTRGLIGYQGELLTDTRGTAVMNRLFHAYAPFKGEVAGRRNGVLISNATGEATAYSLFYLQDRGAMMIDPQTRVYEGMIIGQHTRDNDLVVNIIQVSSFQRARGWQGREHDPDPAHAPHAGAGLVLHRGRRTGRGDAEVDPPQEALVRPQRAQEARARPRSRERACRSV
jgi:GTP-binding protein